MSQEEVTECSYINADITYEEVEQVVRSLKPNKSPGIDGIPNEVLKQKDVILLLWKLLTLCFKFSLIPTIWLKAVISPIPKGSDKDPYLPLNYRGISLLSNVYKVYSSIINKRITKFCDFNDILADEQNGFRRDRSCIDHIFSLSSIIRNRLAEKKSTFCAFIDMEKAFDKIDRNLIFYSLITYNFKGNIYRAIKSLYSETWACVRLQNSIYTVFFPTITGVLQGDNLSPTLFTLYINDLVAELKKLDIGIKINHQVVSLLLYADDLVLITESEQDLQLLLNKLSEWCKKWQIKVNESKSKVMHFRPKRTRATEFKFKYMTRELDMVQFYKYLGVMFDEHLSFQNCAEVLAGSAGRALGGIISKFKTMKDCSFKTFEKLYNAGVVPILDYGCVVWGHKDFKSIDDLQNRAMRFYLGVHKFAPILGLEGETGWLPPKLRRYKGILSFWNRIIDMSNDRVTKVVFNWDYDLQRNNWSSEIKDIFERSNSEQTFYRKEKCSVSNITEKIFDNYKENWISKVRQKPKLRTYKQFKLNFGPEKYLYLNLSKHKRSLLAQFRLGILPLNIETGRYKNIIDNEGNIRKQKPEERLCSLCSSGAVEDELHFLFDCNCYALFRETLFKHAISKNSNFMNQTKISQIEFLMNRDVNKLCSYILLSWECRKELLYIKHSVNFEKKQKKNITFGVFVLYFFLSIVILFFNSIFIFT